MKFKLSSFYGSPIFTRITSSPILVMLCHFISVSTLLLRLKKWKKFLLGSMIKDTILPVSSSIFTSIMFPTFLPSLILTISLLCKSDNLILPPNKVYEKKTLFMSFYLFSFLVFSCCRANAPFTL